MREDRDTPGDAGEPLPPGQIQWLLREFNRLEMRFDKFDQKLEDIDKRLRGVEVKVGWFAGIATAVITVAIIGSRFIGPNSGG